MAWSGKLLGGLFGGMLGGPVGAGVGVAVGHYLGDSEGAERGRRAPLHLLQLHWQHHAFGTGGAGMVLTPVWRAERLAGVPVTVDLEGPGFAYRAVVEPEHPREECHLPEAFIPYVRLRHRDAEEVRVEVRLHAKGQVPDAEVFPVALPGAVRLLGNNGPARVIMALVANARAGGRALAEGDLDFIRTRFEAAQPLDAEGDRWFRLWTKELVRADLPRLGPEKVARRLGPHLDGETTTRVLTWLMVGTRHEWPGEAQVRFVHELAAALGVDAELVGQLWASVDRLPDPAAVARAWRTLGLPPGSPPELVRETWRHLVLQHHPDRARSAEDAVEATRRTAELNAAYDLLTR